MASRRGLQGNPRERIMNLNNAILKDTSPSQMQNFNQICDVEWQHLLHGFAIGFLMDRLQQVLVYEIWHSLTGRIFIIRQILLFLMKNCDFLSFLDLCHTLWHTLPKKKLFNGLFDDLCNELDCLILFFDGIQNGGYRTQYSLSTVGWLGFFVVAIKLVKLASDPSIFR